jgi:putative oxidoreductase
MAINYEKMNTLNMKSDVTLLIARFFLAIVVLAHGVQKLFGWFGGYGFEGTINFFTKTIGLPYLIALSIILLETVGMILLMAGLFSRVFAGGLIIIMLGAIFTMHESNGFFMNWGGNLSGEGYEFHLLIISLALIVVLNGTGGYSLNRYLPKKLANL